MGPNVGFDDGAAKVSEDGEDLREKVRAVGAGELKGGEAVEGGGYFYYF